jgi:DnaJ-class molecular chaperone
MKLAYGIYNNMTKTNDMKQKCVYCDGLGYFYNQATFQSEYCPHCEGKGYIEVNHDLGGPVEQPVVEQPVVVEAPVAKPTKKSTKVVEPTITPEPTFEEPTIDTNSGGDVDGGA